MAPLPSNGTNRLFLDYTSVNIEHTMLLRLADSVTDPEAAATSYATLFAARMYPSDSFFRARFSLSGEDFSLPIPFTAVPGALPSGTPTWPQDPESTQLSFIMRGITSGRRARVEFFTSITTTTWPGDNRYNPGDAAPIDTLRANFEAAAESGGTYPLVTVAGDFTTVYGYVNICQNSYWQRKQRA